MGDAHFKAGQAKREFEEAQKAHQQTSTRLCIAQMKYSDALERSHQQAREDIDRYIKMEF